MSIHVVEIFNYKASLDNAFYTFTLILSDMHNTAALGLILLTYST